LNLKNFIEPDFGLIECLIALNVLNEKEAKDAKNKQTITTRNEQILNYLFKKPWTDAVAFVIALMVSDQQHVVNYILDKAGYINVCVVCNLNV
jgi:hypothetical protein